MLDLNTLRPGEEGPVTVSISRRARQGREGDYEAWIRGITGAASEFPGHQGVSVLRPSAATDGRYVLIYRYDSYANCANWENSGTRADWLAKLDDLIEGTAETRHVTGLEAWFDLPEVPISAPHPPRHKMALILVIVVFALVYPMQLGLTPAMGSLPHWGKTLTIVVIQVLLMTYLVMPRVTQALKRWLYAT